MADICFLCKESRPKGPDVFVAQQRGTLGARAVCVLGIVVAVAETNTRTFRSSLTIYELNLKLSCFGSCESYKYIAAILY